MTPPVILRFSIGYGVKGRYLGQKLKGTYVLDSVEPAGAMYEHFQVISKTRGKVAVTISRNPRVGPREGALIVNDALGKRLTSLFFRSVEHPTVFEAGSPPEDQDAWLGQLTPDALTVVVFPNMGAEKAALFGRWLVGDLEGVEPPK